MLSGLLSERCLPSTTAAASHQPPKGPPAQLPPVPVAGGSAFFTERVMRQNPECYFDELLAQWGIVVESAAQNPSSAAADILRGLSLRETQLLNAKLNEDQFDTPKPKPVASAPAAVSCGENDEEDDVTLGAATYSITALPPATKVTLAAVAGADVPTTVKAYDGLMEVPGVPRSRKGKATNAPPGPQSMMPGVSYFRHYSVAHFAAELDSPELLQFTAGGLPRGIPVCLLPSQVFIPPDAPFPPFFCQAPSPLFSSTGCYPVKKGGIQLAPFDWVARCCADYAGHFLVHRAAMADATQSLAFLVDCFGEEDMLSLRRARSLLSTASWGPGSYQEGKNAVGCAIAVGATSTLAWVLANFPRRLQLNRQELSTALISAALEDAVQTFEFFADNQLFPKPLSDCGATRGTSIADAVVLEGLHSVLEECSCHAALYAAAEAGSTEVLDWYIHTFGEEVLWEPDKSGATALHHCARGGNTAALRMLLVDRRSTDCPNACKHVDDFDAHGRSPAMWCVQGGRKGKHIVDTLLLLESVGSQWRVLRNERGDTIGDVATRYHRPFTKVMRFIRASFSAARQSV